MMAHWSDIKELFEAARALSPEERAAFLEQSCHDEATRGEIASLLQAYDEATGFFESLADSLVAPAWNRLREAGPEEDPLALEGQQVGRYAIEAHLGGGGMGVVYRARDLQLARTVALKFLSPHLASSSEALLRFEREARATSAFDHLNIATIYEIGRTEAGPNGSRRRYIAMAYYEGETLKKKIEGGPLPVEETLHYAIQMAEGLTCAHAAGIVHRDVKSANVIVTNEDVVKLVDFGLAKAADASGLTLSGRRMGTAAYMSPEQARGEDVDARTDLWSVGVLLYEMLTGRRPFHRGRDLATLYAILHAEPVPPHTFRSDLPAALGQIVQGCLEKDRRGRYPTAEALKEDLEAVRRGEASIAFRRRRKASEASGRTVAVLPFETLEAEHATVFTKGIHADVLTRLATVADLQVISRTSVRKYRAADKTIREISSELGADWIVEGEVQETGTEVQVNARLIDARSDSQVWAKDFRRKLTAENVFEIQTEITKKIAGALEATLTPEETKRVEHKPTENLQAYRLYAQGRRNLDQRTEQGMQKAVAFFEQATQEDSSYALAWVGLADALTLRYDYGYEEADSVLPRAESAVQRALELDPERAEAHASLGLLYSNRHQGPQAIQALKRAVALQPSYAEAHNWLSWNYQLLGEARQALESAQRAVELDPLSPEAVSNLSVSSLENRQYKKALVEARRGCEIQPEWATPRFYEGLALYHLQRFEEAIAVLEGLHAPWAGVGPQATLALAQQALSDESGARQFLLVFEANNNPFAAGLVHVSLGNVERAFQLFRGIDTWDDWPTLSVYHFYPDVLDSLRNDPRWPSILRAVAQSRGLVRRSRHSASGGRSAAYSALGVTTEDGDEDPLDASIAVLPFEPLGEEHTNPFIEGIHDDLVSGLARLSGLEVISRTSVMRYRKTDRSLPSIARELGVRWVLEGSVQQVRDKVRVRVRLVDAQTDRQVWTQHLSRNLTAENLFEIQAELTREIARSLEAQLTPEEQQRIEHAPTYNLDAYRLQAQGRRCLDQRTKEGMQKALRYFERAIEHDADYALAWTGLASALVLLHEYGHDSIERVLPRAEEAVERALALDPMLPEAHAARGLLHELHREGGQVISALARAIELRPGYAEAYNLISWHSQLEGHPKQALESAQRAVELNPLSSEAVINLAFAHLINGDAEAALQEAQRVRELDPGWASVDFCEAMVLYHTGRFEEAKSILQDLVVPWAGSGPALTLALIHLRVGDETRIRQMLATFEEAEDRFAAGVLYAACGDAEQAFEAFRSTDWTAYWPVLSVYHYYPDVLDPLRADPRWKEVVQSVRQAWSLAAETTATMPGRDEAMGHDEDMPVRTPHTPNPGGIQRAVVTRPASQGASAHANGERTTGNAIAVLPFEVFGSNEASPFVEGTHDDLIARLSAISGLEVISRTSVMCYRNSEESLPAIARELGVGWVVEGSVQQVSGQVRLRVRLVSARKDRQVWTQGYQRRLTAENLFEIQAEITKEIARALKAQLTPEEERRVHQRPTDNLEAYQLYVQGRGHLHERTEEAVHQAVQYFQEALELDDENALAWSGLADACSLIHYYDYARPEAACDSMEAARRALELDPELGEAHASLGIVHSLRQEGPAAMQALRRATELKPSYAEAYAWLAWLHLLRGNGEEALSPARQAVTLNPLSPVYRVFLAEIYLANGRGEKALREARRARQIQSGYGLTHFMEGLVLYHLGRLEEAASMLEDFESLSLPPWGVPKHAEFRALLAVISARSGHPERTRNLLTQIDIDADPFSAGLIHAALGKVDDAFEAFWRVERWSYFANDHLRYFFPEVLGPVRNDPRFQDLLRRLDESWG